MAYVAIFKNATIKNIVFLVIFLLQFLAHVANLVMHFVLGLPGYRNLGLIVKFLDLLHFHVFVY